MQLFVSALPPVAGVTTVVLTNIIEITDCYLTNIVSDTLLNDVLRQCMQEVVFPK
jgi:hypothetical protein